MSSNKKNQEKLKEKLKANDRAAFNELITLYKNNVINTCHRFLLNEQDAEDISQEVFILSTLACYYLEQKSLISLL